MDGFEALLNNYRAEYEAGDPLALHDAVLLALWNGLPVPEWAAPGLEQILQLHAAGDFRRGKGVPAPVLQSESVARTRGMKAMVEYLFSLSYPEWQAWAGNEKRTQDRVFQEVAEIFTNAYRDRADRKIFTRDMVKAAYYQAERRGSKKGDTSRSDNGKSM